MGLKPLKLVNISKFFFCALVILQAFFLAEYQVHHKEDSSFYALAFLFLPCLVGLGIAICRDELFCRLWLVWCLYSTALVIMIGVIFGGIVIKHHNSCEPVRNGTFCAQISNETFCGPVKTDSFCTTIRNGTFVGQLRDDTSIGPFSKVTFFGPNVLKTTLSFTPAQMLLLLNSVTEEAEILKELYFTMTLNLFDGIEMLEVLLQDRNNAIPTAMRIAVLTAVILFFATSFLEILKEKIEEDGSDSKPRKRTVIVNDAFQIVLNLLFLILRLILWFKYDQDSAIFIAKNVVSLLIQILPYLEKLGCITTESE